MIYKTNESIIVIQAEAINPIQTGVVFWSHDRGTAKLRFKLQKDGVNQNLPEGTTVPIRLVFKSSTAQGGYGKHDYLATIEDRLNGIISIVLENNILGYQGRVDGSIYIDFPNDQSLDTAGRFSFEIKRSPIDDSTPELEDYYFNGFSQTIDKIEQMIADAKTEIDTKTAETKKEFDTELESVKTSITEAENSLSTMNKDMTTLEGKITEADQHFVSKESVEKGPFIFKSTNITTEDWDDIKESGLYYCAASTGINAPYTGKLYGFLTVYNELAVIIQKYEFGPNVYMRTFAGNPATWGSWVKIANTNEVVSLTELQNVEGMKNFVDGLQVSGENVATVNDLDKMATTTIYNSDGEVSDLPYEGTVFGFGSQVNTNGTKPAFSVNENHEAICEIPGTYNVTAQIRLQFNASLDGYVYIDLLKNGTMINANSGMFSIGGNGLRNRNAHAGHNVITIVEGDKLSWKTSSNLSGNFAFAGCFSFAATRLGD